MAWLRYRSNVLVTGKETGARFPDDACTASQHDDSTQGTRRLAETRYSEVAPVKPAVREKRESAANEKTGAKDELQRTSG
ncbi:hypothetical protein [Paraburkholderia azotifigens]|uniref:Uncharacterized protein n=1 Tax=Paraburkholderia azotifigens TaxID=2057004 RepID=A0A5C6VTL2_9BURK|nr:hypothetical protein [Paraburkholderia azotifigens]TXC88507.1 hypothetical protein FRZ40_13440 [Paraburkholderia azotifigens]